MFDVKFFLFIFLFLIQTFTKIVHSASVFSGVQFEMNLWK